VHQTVWDERFAGEEFVYGEAPNEWLVAHQHLLPASGTALALGDGEGRNGVWLAEHGLAVTAVDASRVGLDKAEGLARRRGVSARFRTVCAWVQEADWSAHTWGVVVLCYLHLPSSLRAIVHRRVVESLAPGGLLVLEAFTPRQPAFKTGGPSDPDLLYEPEFLREDFSGLEILHLAEAEVLLNEGRLHQGRSAVVRLLARA
jgi:SAM-dependent methyltransferase